MTRRVLIFLLFLVLGAFLNVFAVVVLSCTISPQMQSQPPWKIYRDPGDLHVFVFRHRRFGVDSVVATPIPPHMDRPFDGTIADLPGWIERLVTDSGGTFIARGWPLRAAYYEWNDFWMPRAPVRPEIGGWKTPLPDFVSPDGWTLARVIPYSPLWRGVIFNTLFYAIVLWAMWLTIVSLRSARRRKRGLCPACKYDLRGGPHGVCPECGK